MIPEKSTKRKFKLKSLESFCLYKCVVCIFGEHQTNLYKYHHPFSCSLFLTALLQTHNFRVQREYTHRTSENGHNLVYTNYYLNDPFYSTVSIIEIETRGDVL